MPIRLSSFRKARPAVHTSGLLGDNRQSGTALANADESPSNSFALPPPSTGETESVHVSAEQRMAGYLELGNQVRLLVREATRKRLKDVDHEANNRVLNFVRLRNCPVVVEELCKILCEKLSSSYIHKQWLAVKLVDRLYTACPTMFGERKAMIVREVASVYHKSNTTFCSKSQKCKIEASCLIQKMTGNILSPHTGYYGGGNEMVASLVPQPNGNGLMLVSPQASSGLPRANSNSNEQHFGVPIASVAHAASPEAGHYVAQAQAQAQVDTNALRRNILDKAQMALQHADILQELLCNFSTGETVPSEEEDTLEMLTDLSDQSKTLLESMNALILKCQEEIEAPGISEAIGESTLAMDKLRESLDLYEDVSHTVKMQMGTSGRRSEVSAASAAHTHSGSVSAADVIGSHGTNRESPRSNRPTPSATPVPPSAVAPLNTRVDTNPFRRLTHEDDGGTAPGRARNERRSLRASTGRLSSSSSSGTSMGPKPSAGLLIDLDHSESSTGTQSEPITESKTPPAEQNKSKEMQQLESLFDTSMDLLTAGPATSTLGNTTSLGSDVANTNKNTKAHPFDNPA